MSISSELHDKRPLSPHLQVYRLPYNAMMSIIGRAVGIALYIALCVILAWFCAIVWKPELFEQSMLFFKSDVIIHILTVKLLLGAFVTFFYLGNGIRHVLWDHLIGVNVKSGKMTGNIVLIVSALLTLALGAAIWM